MLHLPSLSPPRECRTISGRPRRLIPAPVTSRRSRAQLGPRFHRGPEVVQLGLVGLLETLEALLPQLERPDAQLLGGLGVADVEGFLDVFQTGLELGLDGL